MWFEPDMVGDPKCNDTDLGDKFGSAKYEDFSTLELTEAQGSQGHNPLRRLALHRYRLHTMSGWLSKTALKQAEHAIGSIGLARIHDDTSAAGADGCVHHLGKLHHSDKDEATNFKTLELGNVDITKIDVAYVPGSGFLAGLTLYDEINGQQTERLAWKQWEGREPAGLVHIVNEPPERGDGTVWKFAGLAGSWIDTFGQGKILARVSGIWKKVEV